MTYEDLIPDIIHIIKYYVHTVRGNDAPIHEQNLFNYLIRKCVWSHFTIDEPVQGIITCLHTFQKAYNTDDYMFTNDTYRYDIYDVTVNIGEYIHWRNNWLHSYINEYPEDKYYTDIYYDTFKPIISIVIVPFESSITITPYEINGFIYK